MHRSATYAIHVQKKEIIRMRTAEMPHVLIVFVWRS
jgi:hypothetical protein